MHHMQPCLTVLICVYANWGSNFACTALTVHETAAAQSRGTQAALAQHWGMVHNVCYSKQCDMAVWCADKDCAIKNDQGA